MLGRTNSAGGGAILDEKQITANGTYNASSDDLDGYSSVIVNVPSTLKTLLDATKSAYSLFRSYQGSSVDGLIAFSDTSEVTNTSNMFIYCVNLTSVPLLDTGNVTDMSSMFRDCEKLTSIPLFDIGNVTNMGAMLRDCFQLTSVPAFDVTGVANMTYMFYGCSALISILMTNIKADLDITTTALQHDAIIVLIGNLYDFVGAGESTTKTLTMGATKLGYLSQAEKDIALNKGWTLA